MLLLVMRKTSFVHRRLMPPKSPAFVMSEVPLYRGTSLIRNRTPLGPHSRPMPRGS